MDKNLPVADSCAFTDVKVENTTFMWKIKNFSYIAKNTGEIFFSPKFRMGNDDLEWCLHLFPYGKTSEFKDSLSLFLNLSYSFQYMITASFRCSILDVKGEVAHTREWGKIQNFSEGNGWGQRQFIRRADLFNKAADLLPNDTLTIYCEIKAFLGYTNNTIQSNMPKTIEYPLNQARDDFEALFYNAAYSDVTIITNNKKLFVHKCLLAARSPVFYQLLQQRIPVDGKIVIEITEFDDKVMLNVLRYIYLQELEDFSLFGIKLLAAAVHYDLKGLKEICEQNFIRRLNTQNAIDMLIVADKYKGDKLKVEAIQFIATYASEIFNTPDFELIKTSHAHLFTDIFKVMAEQNSGLQQSTNKRQKFSKYL